MGDLELLVRDAWLPIAIVAVRANKSHVFVINERDSDVELIDTVYDDFDIRAPENPKFDPLPDLHFEAVRLLSEGGGGKQGADTNSPEYLFHFFRVAEQVARGNVKMRG